MNYQERLSKSFPYLASIYRKYRLYRLTKKKAEEVFTDIYKKNTWKSSESISGPGSTLESTKNIREELPKIIHQFHIETFLDLPCGDFNWMKDVSLPLKKYIGGDIVTEIIKQNNTKYGNNKFSFLQLNLIESKLLDADLLFCRDCLVHLSFGDITKALINIKNTNIKYLLTTTFPNINSNEDIVTGRWRRLNLEKAPFNFPEPLLIIEENERNDMDRKSLGLWKMDDIKHYYKF